jgi:GNAT superfamily N-acetyltransferase
MPVDAPERACTEDIPSWLRLAAEVESLFGPMVNDERFLSALRRNVERGTAFCIREPDGPPGVPLVGGLLFSPKPPIYCIGWLAVAENWRRQGAGCRLVNYVVGMVQPPAEMVVGTFGEDVEAGRPARRFYEGPDFRPAEPAPNGPEGGSRQIFRRVFPELP